MHLSCATVQPIRLTDAQVGIVVPESRGFRFVALDRRFALLDGSRFMQVQQAEAAAHRLARVVALETTDGSVSPRMRHTSAPSNRGSSAPVTRRTSASEMARVAPVPNLLRLRQDARA
jgi:hypothetical protein